jgi:nucleotide-binding universal stress UspA family protein
VFTSILVPVDFGDTGDRAVPVARSLSLASGLPIELVTVTSPGLLDEFDNQAFENRLAELVPARATTTVIHDEDPLAALERFIGERPDALVVLGTHARTPLGDLFLGSVSEDLLARLDRPAVLVGPRAEHDGTGPPVLVAAVDSQESASVLRPAIEAWHGAFGAGITTVVEVIDQAGIADRLAGGDITEDSLVHRLAVELGRSGILASWEVLHGTDAVEALTGYADEQPMAVLAVASRRWTGAHHCLTSTARRLTRQARQPVLVVPLAEAPASADDPHDNPAAGAAVS